MPSQGFFRDVALPSHARDRAAHERFLLDTYAERRAEERQSVLARVLATFGVAK